MPANPYRKRLTSARMTKTQRLYMDRLMLNLEQIKDESELDYNVQALVPEAWDLLERDVDVEEKKTKVTLLLDDSTAKFYRAMGKGYQARINRILSTFAQMRIAQVRRLEEMAEEEVSKVNKERIGGRDAEELP